MQQTRIPSLGWKDPMEKKMATYSSILAWRVLWTEGLAGLQSMGPDTTEHTHIHLCSFPNQVTFPGKCIAGTPEHTAQWEKSPLRSTQTMSTPSGMSVCGPCLPQSALSISYCLGDILELVHLTNEFLWSSRPNHRHQNCKFPKAFLDP